MSILSFAKKLGQPKKKLAKERQAQQPATKEKQAQSVTRMAASQLELIPVLTEKSVRLQENGVVTFRAPQTVTKDDVAREVLSRWNTTARAIRIVQGRGKQRRRGATYGRTTHWKKVYVTVDDVSSIAATP